MAGLSVSTLHLVDPALLWLMPLALVPLLNSGVRGFDFPGLEDWPDDRRSRWLQHALRLACALAVALLVGGACGPYSEGGNEERIGTGAEIVVVLDRSGSMSEPLQGEDGTRKDFLSKIGAARRVLSRFMRRREGDTFGLVAFNSSPIRVAPLSSDRELAEAALASAEARSVGFTALTRALGMALDEFAGRPETATRLVLLLSDGDAEMDAGDREYLRRQFVARHVQLIWIYVRGDREPSILDAVEDSQSLAMHKVFASMGMPYQAFEVTDGAGLERAIAEIGSLTNRPTRYTFRLPRRDLAGWCYAAAVLLVLLLGWVRLREVPAWAH